MSILGRFNKQPGEVLDYDFIYTDWLTERNDTILTYTVTAEPGLTVDSVVTSNGVVKCFLSGGATGASYKVTCVVTTVGLRTKEAELLVKVKEV